MTADSNVWVGAWWIGFVGAALICFIVAIPLLAFPAGLPGECSSQNKLFTRSPRVRSLSSITLKDQKNWPRSESQRRTNVSPRLHPPRHPTAVRFSQKLENYQKL